MRKLPTEKIKTSGDVPPPRFGHTFTMVSATKAVLFGGAVSVSGRFVITNETFLFDFVTSRWKKLNFKQNALLPSQRAAHAATMVSQMQMVIYGGASSGTQGLLKDELYILDLRKQPVWKLIEVTNKSQTPGQRYGHSMVFSKPHLVIFGGNSGNRAENDVWILNILRGPLTWVKYQFSNSNQPCPRVYHAAAICQEGSAQGMMVVFGGRKQCKKDHNGSQRQISVSALNDIWGLRKHRDGSWDWVTPPKFNNYEPIPRYQHLVTFMGSMLVIMGGRSNSQQETVSQIEIYDTQNSEWFKADSISRYRHAIAMFDKCNLYVHGGFQPEFLTQPLDSLVSINLSQIYLRDKSDRQRDQGNKTAIQNGNRQISGTNQVTNMLKRKTQGQNSTQENQNMNQENSQQIPQSNNTNQPRQLRQMKDSQRNYERTHYHQHSTSNLNKNSRIKTGSNLDRSRLDKQRERDLTPSRVINSSKNIRLSNQVIVATSQNTGIKIERVPVNSLMEESKRLTSQTEDMLVNQNLTGMDLVDSILSVLLYTNSNNKTNPTSLFPFKRDKIVRLCQQALKVYITDKDQKRGYSLVGVRAPAKVYGAIYGRYHDLLKFFETFGIPDDREMQGYQYVFLGNYVDKGSNSLETICLLLALKIKYPDHIVLLRGRHQDININRVCGFGQQCSLRLGQNINDPNSVFNCFNQIFEMMPLAAAIDDKFICLNGNIGQTQSIVDIKNVQRPVKVKDNQTVIDLLWSQSNGNQQLGYKSQKSSQENLERFLQENGLDMIINTRDGILGGLQEEGCTISIFSATNYPNVKNKGAMLKINKNLSVVPCLIQPSSTRKGNWIAEVQAKVQFVSSDHDRELRKTMFQIDKIQIK